MKTLIAVALSLPLLFAWPSSAQISTQAPSNAESERIQNIAPEEMWKRVTQCVFPTYPGLVFNSHIAGTVDIGLGISPKGDVANYRVLAGRPFLVPSAVEAIRQWKFRPNVVQGEVTWSRVRALVRFNADGTTAIELEHAILADNFGDPGTPVSSGAGSAVSTSVAVPRPETAPACKSTGSWTGASAKEIEASELSPGFYKSNYFGLSFHFPVEWQVADRAALDSHDAKLAADAQAKYGALPSNVQTISNPFYTLFFARTDGGLDSLGPSFRIWTEKEPFISNAEQYFPNSQFLMDKTVDGTRGPEAIEINGWKFYRGDRWGTVQGHTIYQVRLVTYARDLILAIDIQADSAATAEQLVKKSSGITINPLETERRERSTEQSTSPANMQLGRLARQAYGMSADQASRLEEGLSHDPNDLAARAQLLGYYFAAGRQLSPETVHEARLRHILWLVQNHPESELAGMSEATIDPAGGPLADRAGYEKVKALWLEQVKAHDDTVMVLVNAAWFFKLPDKAIAAGLLTRAHAIEPGNRNWSVALGMVYAGAIVGLTGMNQNRLATEAEPEEARGPFAQKAREELNKSEDAEVVGTAGYYLHFWGTVLNAQGKTPSDYADLTEKCLARAQAHDPGNPEWAQDLANVYEVRAIKAKSPEERTAILRKRLENLEKALSTVSYRGALADSSDLANAAFEAGEFEKAETYARKALELASQNRTDHYYGAALNHGNAVLGRVALHVGDLEKAKSFLLAAGRIPREPKFDSFPDMRLAKELLEHGQRQSVLDYLELCKSFWSGSGNPLDGWIETIKSGGTPNWPVN